MFGIAQGSEHEYKHEPMFQPIDNENLYSTRSVGISPGTTVEPVIFEPIRNVKLSRSTVKVTSFIDFTSIIQSFNGFEDYLNKFVRELFDPRFETEIEGLGLGQRDQGQPCRGCVSRNQLEEARQELIDIKTVFQGIKTRFFEAIDHLEEDSEDDYTDTESEETSSRKKRQVHESSSCISSKYSDVSQEEKEFLIGLFQRLIELDKDGTHNWTDSEVQEHERTKRFVADLIMGWGIFSNAKNIKEIKKNIKILYRRDRLLDFKVKELAYYLNLTATQVRVNTKGIYEIDARVLNMDKNLKQLTRHLDNTVYYSLFMFSVQHRLSKLSMGLNMLSMDVEKVYEYLRVLSSHKINPMAVPPPQLRKTLKTVDEGMKSNPRLELPYDPNEEIWPYYNIVRVTPVVLDSLLVIVLTIPLIDKSLKMNIFKVHNMPSLHPVMKLQATYELEGEYFAMDQNGLFVALPSSSDIHLCLASGGGLCVMNQALYPVDKVNWCIYALFMLNENKIKENCLIKTRPRFGNLAQSLGGYLWAISSLAGHSLQIRCIKETRVIKIEPPLQIVHIGNGCEGYSPSITIPAKSELTSQMDYQDRTDYFLGFNANYTQIPKYGAWVQLKLEDMTPEELDRLRMKLSELPPMNFETLNKKLPEMDMKYPWSIPPNFLLFIMIGLTVVAGLFVIFCLWRVYKMKKGYKVMKPWGRIIRGRPVDGDMLHLNEIITGILSHRSPARSSRTQEAITSPDPSTHVSPRRQALPAPGVSIVEVQEDVPPIVPQRVDNQILRSASPPSSATTQIKVATSQSGTRSNPPDAKEATKAILEALGPSDAARYMSFLDRQQAKVTK